MFQMLLAHPKTVIAFGTLVITSFAKTMPPKFPWTGADIYYWVFDSIHQFFNINNPRLVPGGSIPDPPASNPNPK